MPAWRPAPLTQSEGVETGLIQNHSKTDYPSKHLLQAGYLPLNRIGHGIPGKGFALLQSQAGKDVALDILHLHPDASSRIGLGVYQEANSLLHQRMGRELALSSSGLNVA